MLSAFERLVALRYLRARRQEGFISVVAWFSLLGIMLGVATLIIVMSVMNGFREELLSRILGVNGHIQVYAQGQPITDYQTLTDRIRQIQGVAAAMPLVKGQVMATANGASSGALAHGIREADLKGRGIIADNIRFGTLDGFGESGGVAVGMRMARKMGLGIGSKITLISTQGTSTAFGTMPRLKSYPVVAIFEVGMSEYDSVYLYMPFSDAQVFFRQKEAAGEVEVMVDDPERAQARAAAIQEDIGRGYQVMPWQQVNQSFFTALEVERNVMFLILTLIIVVAAFNVISSQVMLVHDKGKGIAILRTIGATRASVLRIFFMTGASVGVIGTVLGSALGTLFSYNIETIRQWIQTLVGLDLFQAEIYFLSRLPAKVDPGEVILVVGMALALSFLASIYPAWRAARMDPVEALRYE